MSVVAEKPSSVEWIRDHNIYHDSLSLGVDYLEATGKLPEPEHFRNLMSYGYIDYSPQEIEGVFKDWEVFHGDISLEHEISKKEEETRKRELLETIAHEEQLGRINPFLFRKFKPKKSKTQKQKELEGIVRKHNDLKVPLSSTVSENEKIKRYCLFKIAERLTRNLELPSSACQSEMSASDRRTSIALQINISNWKRLSSYPAELQKSNFQLGSVEDISAEVEQIARDEGWMDYLFPELRQRYLSSLQVAALSSVEISYQSINLSTSGQAQSKRKSPRVRPSNTRLVEQVNPAPVPDEEITEYYFDKKIGKLIGALALEAHQKEFGTPSEYIYRLGEVLTQASLDIDFSNRRRFDGWNNDEYLKYGKWLVGILEPQRVKLTRNILERADSLGIGPSVHRIRAKKRFGSVVNFYKQLEIVDRNRYGEFDQWTFRDFVNYIQEIAQELGRSPTQRELWDRQKQGDQGPSPAVIRAKTGSVSAVFEAAGLPYKKALSLEDYIKIGVDYAKNNGGKAPTAATLTTAPYLPSASSVLKRFGKLSNFQEQVRTAYQQEIAAQQTTDLNQKAPLAA